MSVAGDVATTKGFIETQIGNAEGRADSSISAAFDAINQMAQAASEVTPSLDFSAPSININTPIISGTGPTAPTLTSIRAAIGSAPGGFTATIAERAMQSAPQEGFVSPTINFPTAPVSSTLVKPSALAIALPGNMPDAPSITLPTDLTINRTVPVLPTISLPAWGETLPVLDISLPETTLAYVEPAYTSLLKTAITSNLLDGVNNGGTGLGATVQTAIWNKDIERLSQQKDDDVEEVLAKFSGRGFDMPTGMVAQQVNEVLKEFTNNRSQNSRDVMIKEAEMAFDMSKFFLSTGLNLEQIEINHANNIANRALEAEKAVIQFSIDLFNSKVTKHNLDLETYKAKAIEVEVALKVQELILSQYLAEINGVEAGVKIDSTKIANYNAILAKHTVSIALYEAEIGAVVAQLNIERAKSEIFKAQIDGYIAEIQGQKNEYDLYLAKIEGESAKIDIHKTEVEAYATRVNAVKVSNDVVIAQINADISEEELNLKAHLATIETYKARSDQGIAEMNVEADLYRTNSGVFDTLIKNASANAELNVQTQIRAEALTQANAAMSLEAAKANLQATLQANEMRVQAASAQASASSAMSGMVAGAIQGMLQLGGQGTSIETVDNTP